MLRDMLNFNIPITNLPLKIYICKGAFIFKLGVQKAQSLSKVQLIMDTAYCCVSYHVGFYPFWLNNNDVEIKSVLSRLPLAC